MTVSVQSYSRRRKPVSNDEAKPIKDTDEQIITTASHNSFDDINSMLSLNKSPASDGAKPSRLRNKRKNPTNNAANGELMEKDMADFNEPLADDDDGMKIGDSMDEIKPSVKLVISKKKGSIFKSRAIDVNSGKFGKKKNVFSALLFLSMAHYCII